MTINPLQWLTALHSHHNQGLLKKALEFAMQHHDEARGIAIADVMLSLQCDDIAIAAAIIYPAITHDHCLLKLAHEQFEKKIIKIVSGAMQMNIIHHASNEKKHITAQQHQIDNLRKMMLAMVDDIRTVLLKLSEQLVLLKEAKKASPTIKQTIGKTILDYYAPLANRLGIGHLKWQLEDGAFQYLYPSEFQRIKNAIHMRKEDRRKLIDDVIARLKIVLKKNDMTHYQLSGRAKHFYSIFRKIERKKIDFDTIYDVAAVRILVSSVTDCYTALGLVHNEWSPISAEFDDYIAKPKSNGYQSIHTAVLLENNLPIEIQIRTVDMHEKAELGMAAHWKYKENKTIHEAEEQKIQLLRNLLDWQKHALTEENKTQLYRDAFHDRVYVFSPAGDVYDLEKGATPLDFAYLIHTDIGHRCRGAKVNSVLVPLTYTLQTGDRIEIVISKENHPSRDWVRSSFGFLKTMHGIRKVKQWFRKLHYHENVMAGSALWEKQCRQHQLQKSDIEKVVHDFNLQSTDALFAALGSGDINVNAVIQKLLSEQKQCLIEQKIIVDHRKNIAGISEFSVAGNKHLLTQLAHCCHPIPGDPIIGYITQGHGITVHQKYCRNLYEMKQHRPERLIHITWENQPSRNFQTNLFIQSEDRNTLLHDLSGLIAQLNLSILSIRSQTSKQNNTVGIELTLEIKHSDELENVLKKIKQISGVFAVTRKLT